MAKKDLIITLIKSELIYEVHNKTYLTGASRNTGENYEQVANMQMGDDDEHKNQILRSLGDSFRELKAKVSNYLVVESREANNIQDEESGDLKLALKMPANFNQAVSDSIASGCHRYLVNSAICDWFMITNPAEAKNYAELANIALLSIRESLNKRTIPTRVVPNVE